MAFRFSSVASLPGNFRIITIYVNLKCVIFCRFECFELAWPLNLPVSVTNKCLHFMMVLCFLLGFIHNFLPGVYWCWCRADVVNLIVVCQYWPKDDQAVSRSTIKLVDMTSRCLLERSTLARRASRNYLNILSGAVSVPPVVGPVVSGSVPCLSKFLLNWVAVIRVYSFEN